MSNSVATFTFYQNVINSDKYNHYMIIAYSDTFEVFLSLDNLSNSFPTSFGFKNTNDDKAIHVDVTKEQVAHFLSLDCPDAFIAYALTLCPCPPETSEHIPNTDKAEADGGIFYIAKKLKEIEEQINLINGQAFQDSALTDDQHYQLLDVEMLLSDFIAPYSYREVVK